MNISTWVMRGAITNMAQKQCPWAKDRPKGFVRFVGTAEILGALGVVLPLLTRILPSVVTYEGETS